MGPAVLVTLGILFLLANAADYPFHRTWPILLIVIGAIKVFRYVVPDDGHNPGPYPPTSPGQYPPPYQPVAPNMTTAGGPVVTPPPAPVAGNLGSGGEGEVRNG
ncbi:MAG TPA: DUF5668 domain-containing protein [Candidatus Saccharimonadales bacterium]|nr:DUF5668 domain-containing protein [Candidatus Saccharimonadales bacterium]